MNWSKYALYAGTATRYCDSNGQWREVDVLNCSSTTFLDLERQVSMS